MGDLSQHFSALEFACKDGCGFGAQGDDIHPELIVILERLRQHFGVPVKITSGCRCVRHNRRVRGAKRSQHLYGSAADIKVQGVSPRTVHAWLKREMKGWGGLGLYTSWVHVDVRQGAPARW